MATKSSAGGSSSASTTADRTSAPKVSSLATGVGRLMLMFYGLPSLAGTRRRVMHCAGD